MARPDMMSFLVQQFLSHREQHYHIYIESRREDLVSLRPQRSQVYIRRTAVFALFLVFQDLFQRPSLAASVCVSFAFRFPFGTTSHRLSSVMAPTCHVYARARLHLAEGRMLQAQPAVDAAFIAKCYEADVINNVPTA